MFFIDTDVADHEAVIESAARQPWCDGNVVLFGTSYCAMVQPLVAVRRPQALRGFFGYGTDTDYLQSQESTPQTHRLSPSSAGRDKPRRNFRAAGITFLD